MQYGVGHYEIGSREPPTRTCPHNIARALSRVFRFTGHSDALLSIARHSVFTALILKDQGHSARVQLYGLVHDIHETVVNDLGYAIKQALSPEAQASYEALADAADEALYKVLGVAYPMPEAIAATVKVADWIAVATEKRDLMPPGDRPWTMMPHPPSKRTAYASVSPNEDMADWLALFSELKTRVALEDCSSSLRPAAA